MTHFAKKPNMKLSLLIGSALLALCVVTGSANLAFAKGAKEGGKAHFCGGANYYHSKFHGKRTASGQLHDKTKLVAAHRTLPFGTCVKVTNKRNGKCCVVTVNDRGPFTRGKVIDVSQEAAKQLGLLSAGTGQVDCCVVNKEEAKQADAAKTPKTHQIAAVGSTH